MSKLRTAIIGAAIALSAGFATLTPSVAADTRFYIGPGGIHIYVDKDGNRYRDRYYRDRYYGERHVGYGRCFKRVSYTWRWGDRYRVVDKVCRDRRGRTRVVDRNIYRVG